jgi:hypothetical protein
MEETNANPSCLHQAGQYISKKISKLREFIKNGLSLLLLGLIRSLHKLYRMLTKNNPSDSSLVSLAPQVNKEESPKFLKCLSDALENSNIRNIAISGIYGSGKSTFLKTFEYFHKEYSYLNISLASFNSLKAKKENEGSSENVNENNLLVHDNLLEKSILQQMVYHVRNNSLPDSRLKRIIHMSKGRAFFRSLCIVIWLASIFMVLQFRFWEGKKTYESFFCETPSLICLISYFTIIATFIVGLICLVYFFCRLLNNAQFSKLNLKTLEIKLFDDKIPSVLSYHIDEILYFFEATKFDVVIFEDLDRFNNTDIFVKLRELNILINKSEQINRDVTFIYAIKDDMFTDEERTKFFDFIIPIIPVVTSTNSKQKLIARLEQLELINDDLSEEFLSDISLYISDMRMLNNIVNEFIIYKQRIGDNINQLRTDRLFAMVVYKNIYPTDFAELHRNKGIVYNTLNEKSALASEYLQKNQDVLKELKKRLGNAKKETLNSIFELRSAYVMQLIKILNNDNIVIVEGKGLNASISKLTEDDEFEKFRKNSITGYKYYNSGRSNIPSVSREVSFQDVEDNLSPHIPYTTREKTVLDKEQNNINSLKEEISKLENEIREIQSYSLSKLINQFNPKWKPEMEDKDLLKFLIRNGFINEEFKDYISYFYPGTISANDKEFLLSVKNHRHLGYDYSLDNHKEVIKSIREYEFKQEEVLNFDLVDSLLQNKELYQSQLDSVIKQLSNGKDKSVEFIDKFIQCKRGCLSDFVKMICRSWEDFWIYIEQQSNYDANKVYDYLRLILTHAELEDIEALNKAYVLFDFISKQKKFFHIIDDIERLKCVIDRLLIEFEDLYITKDNRDKTLFDYVYKHYYYQINPKMIELILTHFNTNKSIDLEKLKTANYTTIRQSDCENLKKYIDGNIGYYLSCVFFCIKTNVDESEETIIDLLNNENVEEDDKNSIIGQVNTVISQLNYINQPTLWKYIINSGNCTINWENIISYYGEVKELDECLMRVFSNKEYCEKLSKTEMKLESDEETIESFCAKMILAEDIPDKCYEYLLSSVPYWYGSLNFCNMPRNKVEIIFKKGKLNFTLFNYETLKTNFSDLHIEFLGRFFEKYLESEEFTQFQCNADDYCKLFSLKNIQTSLKGRLIKALNLNIYQGEATLSNKVGEIITQIGEIINFNLIDKLVKNGSSPKMKIDLLLCQFDNLNIDQITIVLLNSGGKYAEITEKGCRPRLENNDMNYKLVKKLNEIKYISSFTKDEKKNIIRVNTKRI